MRENSPFRVALMGHDRSIEALTRAAEASSDFQIVADLKDPAHDDTFRADSRSFSVQWEAVLTDNDIDLVAFAPLPESTQDAARQADQLKHLMQVGMPMILVHPVCDMLQTYELDMNRTDESGPIFPYCAVAEHPSIVKLCTCSESGQTEFGTIEQVTWERFVPEDERDRSSVLKHVARDVTVLRRLIGDVSSVSATGPTAESNHWGTLGIHFSGTGQPIARWALAPQQDSAGIRLTLVTTQRTVSEWIPDDRPVSRPELDENAVGGTESCPRAEAFLCRVAGTLRRSEDWSGVTWEDVCQSLEVTDAVERSIRRQRTIDLFHEPVTERETFKSMMAAGGCGMLAWVLLLLLIAGILDGLQLSIRGLPIWRLWLVLLFAPLAAFLGLQLLQLVFPSQRLKDHTDP